MHARRLWLIAPLALIGCDTLKPYQAKTTPPPTNAPTVVQASFVDSGVKPSGDTSCPELVSGHEKFRAGDYTGAYDQFHKASENQKNGPRICEEAKFYEAEALFKQDKLPTACDTYHRILIDFPAGTYRSACVRRMFDIANFWLEDTRKEMADAKERREGKKSWSIPTIVHLEKNKPILDVEGRALQALEQVHLNDITGPLADKALFLAGGVKFYREDYREADHFFTQLCEMHKDSPLAAEAVKLNIICKHMSTGGPEYDGRKCAEARLLIDTALRNYPELASKERGFLERQLASVNLQQAMSDYQRAEFYERTGHPGAAYFSYEVVRRRYPGTQIAERATDKMLQLKSKAEAENNAPPAPPGFWEQAGDRWDRMWGKKPGDKPDRTEGPTALTKPLSADALPNR